MNYTITRVFHWIDSLTNLIYPKFCVGCHSLLLEYENVICLNCDTKLPIAPYIVHKENPVTSIFKGRVPIEFGSSFLVFNKGGLAQKLIHKLKYNDREDIGEFLGAKLGSYLSGIEKPDMIIPIPLHHEKLISRGYNQSESIANGIGKVLNVPVDLDLIERTISNPSQTKLNRFNRWENVKGIFKLTRSTENIKYVWLIDDTLTTGSTIESCASILVEKGLKVGVLTLAYAK